MTKDVTRALHAMLGARSVALVGASPRPGSFGERMVAEMARSPAAPAAYLVNPKYAEIGGVACHPSLADLPGPSIWCCSACPTRRWPGRWSSRHAGVTGRR